MKFTFTNYHEKLNCCRHVHEPERSLVFLPVSAVKNGMDVGGLVDAGNEPAEGDDDY